MARPKLLEPHTNWKVSVPAPLAARISLEIMDPITRKPKYGAQSKLIVYLLERYLAEREGAPIEPPIPIGDLI